MAKKPKVGDIFEIPLSVGRKAYGQYLHQSKMGSIVQIFDIISKDKIDLKQIILSPLQFPPVIVGLYAAIKEGYWKIIGQQSISEFVHPKFISTFYDEYSGKARIWFLWDGYKEVKIGPVLPEEYKRLEYLVVWNPPDIVERIETGEVPFPYADLIKNNKFTPLK
jgi:hypothetical protein